VAKELIGLLAAWRHAESSDERGRIWRRVIEVNADQVFSIGIVASVKQPIVVVKALRNVPERGVYNWDPGAFFGSYRPDTFWFAVGASPGAER
jgi:peptide/nickel transport system substrate-binding protein